MNGQLDLAQEIVMGIVVIGVLIVVGFKITDGMVMTEDTWESGNHSGSTDAIETINNNLSTVAIIGISTIVLALVMTMRGSSTISYSSSDLSVVGEQIKELDIKKVKADLFNWLLKHFGFLFKVKEK